jgi:PIN domain nuclease of toxin-antitoxin system
VTVLDTHVLVWLAEDSPSLGRRAARLADRAMARDQLLVCAISFWEIAMLAAKRRLRLALTAATIRQRVLEQGIREVAVSGAIAIAAAELAGLHGDPADRLIVATALSLEGTLVTGDESILGWRGPLRRRDARR